MCFSATASFTAGVSLSAMGVVTVRKAKTKTELPFALIPLIFGVQQLLEGLVWVSFGTSWLNWAATHSFVMFSHVFWPIFAPFSLMLLEHDRVRRKIMVFFFGVGLAVGLAELYLIITQPIASSIAANSIVYTVPGAFGFLTIFLYLMATCLSCAFSSYPMVKVFGLTLFASFLAAYYFYAETCLSVWCFFAAILSLIVFLHFYFFRHGRRN